MVSNTAGSWTVRGVTFLLWAVAAASVAYWGLKLSSAGAQGSPAAAGARPVPPADPAAVARVLGHAGAPVAGPASAPPLASRFNLVGVVADRSQHGAALIAVDGRPAKPYRVGAAIDEGLVLQSVQARRATLAASAGGPAVVTLELPTPAR
jgi:general secretion pathway protein C